MTTSELNAELALRERIHREMADTLDEELELELDDSGSTTSTRSTKGRSWIAGSISGSCCGCRANWSSCRTGFSTSKQKVVVLFEGRRLRLARVA